MHRTTTGKKNIMLRLAMVLLMMVMLTSWMTSGLLARYTAQFSGSDKARVADFVFDVSDTGNVSVDLSGIQKPGDQVSCTFTVTNSDAQGTSEVKENYQMELELRGSLPLVCQLTENNQSLVKVTGNAITEAPGVASGESSVCTFNAAVQATKTYTLTVTWPEAENDLKFSRAGLAELVLTIAAEQVD